MGRSKNHQRAKRQALRVKDICTFLDEIEKDLEQAYFEDDWPDPQEDVFLEYSDSPRLTPQTAPSSTINALDTETYLDLFEDQWHRFKPHEHLMGHALIDMNDPELGAKQFNPPIKDSYGVQYTQINHIRLFKYQGQIMALGEAEDGTQMIARRSVKMNYTEDGEKSKYKLLLFSPLYTSSGVKKSLGQHKPSPLLREEPPTRSDKHLYDELEQGPIQHKGGKVALDSASIAYRGTHKRSPQQKKVMGKNADSVIFQFYQKYQNILSDKMKTIMEWMIQQKNEWTHAIGYRLSPLSFNPQTKENLVAGPAWLNTKMNVTEKFALYHAEHGQDKETKLKCWLDTLPNSDIIDSGSIKAKVYQGQKKLTMKQKLNAWLTFPIYSQVTDIPQTVLVSESLLSGQKPYVAFAQYLGKVKNQADLEQQDRRLHATEPSDVTEIAHNLGKLMLSQ